MTQLQRQLSSNGETANLTPQTSVDGADKTKRFTKEELYDERISELEDEAEKQSNPIARKMGYVKAALATKAEDYNRAKRIAEKIDDDVTLRSEVVSFLLYRGALFLIEKAEIERAAELAPQISDVLRRSVVRIAIAR